MKIALGRMALALGLLALMAQGCYDRRSRPRYTESEYNARKPREAPLFKVGDRVRIKESGIVAKVANVGFDPGKQHLLHYCGWFYDLDFHGGPPRRSTQPATPVWRVQCPRRYRGDELELVKRRILATMPAAIIGMLLVFPLGIGLAFSETARGRLVVILSIAGGIVVFILSR